MGLSYADARAIGIGHLHPAACGGKSPERELLDRIYAAEAPATKAPEDGMNKLERAFRDYEVLEPAWVRGSIRDYGREAIKLRLAGRTWYTPDFVVAREVMPHMPHELTFVEVKGFMRDDAAVKLKMAAEKYRCYYWLLVTRPVRREGWVVREVTARGGIGRESIVVPWMHREGI